MKSMKRRNRRLLSSTTKMLSSQNSVICAISIVLIVFAKCNECLALKRSAAADYNLENTESGSDRLNVNFDEYPMVVPKRAAMLLDRLMVALHHALEDGDKEGVQRISDLYAGSRSANKISHLNKEQAQHYMADNEKDMNFYEIPMPIDKSAELNLNQLESRQSNDDTMGLQRRGHGEEIGPNKGRVYWRCYFNAVSCF